MKSNQSEPQLYQELKRKRKTPRDYDGDFSDIWIREDGKRTFLMLPNCLLFHIVKGCFTYNEIRILLYVARRSFGFRQEETCYLAVDDFSEVLECDKGHISKHLKTLISGKVIFRGKEKRGAYKYAVNMLSYSYKMKHYRFADSADEARSGDIIYCSANDVFGYWGDSPNAVVLYSEKAIKQE